MPGARINGRKSGKGARFSLLAQGTGRDNNGKFNRGFKLCGACGRIRGPGYGFKKFYMVPNVGLRSQQFLDGGDIGLHNRLHIRTRRGEGRKNSHSKGRAHGPHKVRTRINGRKVDRIIEMTENLIDLGRIQAGPRFHRGLGNRPQHSHGFPDIHDCFREPRCFRKQAVKSRVDFIRRQNHAGFLGRKHQTRQGREFGLKHFHIHGIGFRHRFQLGQLSQSLFSSSLDQLSEGGIGFGRHLDIDINIDQSGGHAQQRIQDIR